MKNKQTNNYFGYDHIGYLENAAIKKYEL